MTDTYMVALEHVEATIRGDAMSKDYWNNAMVYGAALLCINDVEHPPDCEALVRLSYPTKCFGIRLEEVHLGEDFEKVLREDAKQVLERYGRAVAVDTSLVLKYNCLRDQGDRELMAQGTVVGKCDALLSCTDVKSLLEIKAVKDIQCVHAAQGLFYADMYKDELTYVVLWDTRQRRVYEWNLKASVHRQFAQCCIRRFLEHGNGNIPGVRGRVVPQMVRVDKADEQEELAY